MEKNVFRKIVVTVFEIESKRKYETCIIIYVFVRLSNSR